MTTLFDYSESARAKEHGLAVAIAQADGPWLDRFNAMALHLLDSFGSVSSEEVTARIGPPPGSANHVGAAMRAFAKKNRLRVTWERCAKVSSHARLIGRWSR